MSTDTPQARPRSKHIRAVLLSAGAGTRLASVSNGVSKGLITIDPAGAISGCEHISRIISALGIHDVIVTVGAYAEQYKEFAEQKSYKLFHIPEGSGNGDYLEDVIKMYGIDAQYLVLATDTYLHKKDLARLIQAHKPGTISWGVAKHKPHLLMDSYHGLIANAKGAVLGDIMLPEWKNKDLDGLQLFTKGAIQIIDPELYLQVMSEVGHHSSRKTTLDLYWDIMPLLERRNSQLVAKGAPSIMNVVVFKHDLIDYGTPERLELTRQHYRPNST